MANTPGKVIRQHKMKHEGLNATLICAGGTTYNVEIHKSMDGLSSLVKRGNIDAPSNRVAIKKLQSWLNVRYPVKKETAVAQTKRAQLEALFQ